MALIDNNYGFLQMQGTRPGQNHLNFKHENGLFRLSAVLYAQHPEDFESSAATISVNMPWNSLGYWLFVRCFLY